MPYTIKDMSKLMGLPASTLRYYDKQGLLPNLRRDANNTRIFTEDDYHQLLLIDCLKRSGLSIKDIKHFIDMTAQGDEALSDRLEIFKHRRAILKQELANLQEVLSIIEYKCWYYETASKFGTEESLKNIQLTEIPEQYRKARQHLLRKI